MVARNQTAEPPARPAIDPQAEPAVPAVIVLPDGRMVAGTVVGAILWGGQMSVMVEVEKPAEAK